MISKVLRAIIMGPPGAGKGTISERIVKDFAMTHYSSGEILRTHMREGTDIGLKAKHYIDTGHLVPDELMEELIADELLHHKDHNWLLDGFPRTVRQAEALYNHLQKQSPVDVVLNLDVPFDVIIDRIKGRWIHPPSGRIYHTEFNPPKIPGKCDVSGDDLVQREDDKEHTVRARLDNYLKLTKPVLEFYREHDILMEFSGTKSNEIWPKIHKYLSTFQKPHQYTHYD